jgi:hypothetical protein
MKSEGILVQQLNGIAMGISPAPPIANLYVTLHKSKEILPVIANNLFFCVRFIDDGLAICKHDSNPTLFASVLHRRTLTQKQSTTGSTRKEAKNICNLIHTLSTDSEEF